MAIADTAENAVAEKHRVDILLIKEALMLVGPDRGLEFELGGKKFKVPPMLKANPPPDKGSWRRSGAAPATTKAPYKHRAAKHEGAKPALPSATLHSPDCQSKEQHQPGAADATEKSRQRRRARRAPANPVLRLRPRRHYRRCRRAAMRRGCRPACGWAGRGCGAATWPRRGLHEAEGAGSRGVPIEWTSLG